MEEDKHLFLLAILGATFVVALIIMLTLITLASMEEGGMGETKAGSAPRPAALIAEK